ncbi:hypothetical protein SCUCBS95973_006657 [Sporothrix curviconia]|uniref:Methyltransferase domain-containing protein n=1 Tax=Sporothrix curviconia TaxID=1260050 RepID=A0ABP0C9G0_9PEZI
MASSSNPTTAPAAVPAGLTESSTAAAAAAPAVEPTTGPPALQPTAEGSSAAAPVETAEMAATASTPISAPEAGANRPAPDQTAIEVDNDEVAAAASISSDDNTTDNNSSFSDEGYAESSTGTNVTTSLSSSVRDYQFENNRRYHKFHEGKYHFPNDEPEQAREDMRHCMMVHASGGALHYAPLKNPQKVLDIGTGTGIWAIDMGDEYPEAEVIGIDLSPIQPSWVPANVRFIVDDAEQPWVTAPATYDYIHVRNMASAIKHWDRLMEQVFTALKPGGWIEIQDINWIYRCDDDTMGPDYAVGQMAKYIGQALMNFGIKLYSPDDNPARLETAGFVDIRNTVDKVPVGTWPRDPNMKMIGLYNRSTVYDGLHGITMGPLTRGLKWTPEEVELFLVRVRRDLMNPRIHSYVHMHTLCGQKPY